MYRCPICHKENTTLQCTCGFDGSKDYEGYPTLAPLNGNQPSRKAFEKKLQDLHRCKGCGGVLFYLNPTKGVCVCAECGKEVTISAPKPAPQSIPPVVIPTPPAKSAPEPVTPAKPASPKVNTYDSYLKALEKLYLDKGKRPLTPYEIGAFMKEHQLTARYSIYASDIQKDLETIYRKYAPNAQKESISSYAEYMQALELLYTQNGKKPLSNAQVINFITTNSLDKKFQVTISDVRKDLIAVADKHKQLESLSKVLQQKTTKDTASLSSLLSQLTKKK